MSAPITSFLQGTDSPDNQRPQVARTQSNAGFRPRPAPLFRRGSELADENVAPSNEMHTHHHTTVVDCPLRRTTELPAPKPTRSQSMADGLAANRGPLRFFDDDLALKLPTMPGQATKSITGQQVADLIRSMGTEGCAYRRLLILDARYDYEYDGGHILGAENVYQPFQQEEIKQRLLEWRLGADLCVVIHCEYSSHRGPALFRMLRAFDREVNAYPNLSIPEMYLLHGGYKEFYGKFPELCNEGYVPMHDQAYQSQLTNALKRSQSQSKMKKLSRSSSELARLSPLGRASSPILDDDLAASSSSEPTLRRRVLPSSSSSIHADNFVIHTSQDTHSSELTLYTSSSDDEDDESRDLFNRSPALVRVPSTRFAHISGRGSAPPRSATMNSLGVRRNFTRSTSDLPCSDDEQDNFLSGPKTSRH